MCSKSGKVGKLRGHFQVEILVLHQNILIVIYRDYDSSFQYYLNKDHSQTTHQCNLHDLVKESFKVGIGTASEKMNVFPITPYQFRDDAKFKFRII